MGIDVRLRSRLRFATSVEVDGYEFWDLVEYPTLEVQPDDTVYQVMSHDRLDLIAYRTYGDPILWWVLAIANDLDLVPTALYEGQILRIPAARYINEVVFSKVLVR